MEKCVRCFSQIERVSRDLICFGLQLFLNYTIQLFDQLVVGKRVRVISKLFTEFLQERKWLMRVVKRHRYVMFFGEEFSPFSLLDV